MVKSVGPKQHPEKPDSDFNSRRMITGSDSAVHASRKALKGPKNDAKYLKAMGKEEQTAAVMRQYRIIKGGKSVRGAIDLLRKMGKFPDAGRRAPNPPRSKY